MDLGEKGRVHSNIPDSHTVKVVDGATGRVIGQVSAAAAESGNVVLGGRTWRVTHSGRDQASVAPSGASADGLARFGRHQAGGAFARYLPDELRGR
jgi:ATP-dependent Lhr-like helicase